MLPLLLAHFILDFLKQISFMTDTLLKEMKYIVCTSLILFTLPDAFGDLNTLGCKHYQKKTRNVPPKAAFNNLFTIMHSWSQQVIKKLNST